MHYHLSSREIDEYLDGSLPAGERDRATRHIGECPECAAVHRARSRFDHLARRLPVERAGRQFTADVMHALGIATVATTTFRVLEQFAYAFAMAIVLGVVAAIFVATGVISAGQVQTTQSAAGEAYQIVAGGMTGFLNTAGAFAVEYFPFITRSGSAGVFSLTMLVVLGLGIIDWRFGKYLRARL